MARRVAATLLVATLVACTSGSDEAAQRRTPTPDVSETASVSSPSPTAPPPSTVGGDAHETVSVPALIEKEIDGGDLRVGRVRARTSAYTSYNVTYRSGRLRISGIMNVPRGSGPFPALVLAHGYIDPAIYRTGQGFERSQQYLASRGFVVLHVDYRNHATSDDDPNSDLHLRLGYVEDTINAGTALRESKLPYVDEDRIGLLGRSMGGGVGLTVAVVRPKAFDAIAVFAPVSSDAVDNFNRWIRRGEEDRRALSRRIIDEFGSPEANPAFWRNASARTFFERVEVPIHIHHGTADDTCPFEWSQETLAELRRHEKDVRLYSYPGQGHQLYGTPYSRAMSRTVSFFRANLR